VGCLEGFAVALKTEPEAVATALNIRTDLRGENAADRKNGLKLLRRFAGNDSLVVRSRYRSWFCN
jgi:hypothetical protein